MCLLCLTSADPSAPGTAPAPALAAGQVTDFTALLAYVDTEWARWNATERLRSPVIVSYSFTETADLPTLAEYDPYGSDGYFTFSTAQRAAFRTAAAVLERTAGVVLVEKPAGAAMINLFNSDGTDWAGWANYPSVSEFGGSAGYLVMDYPPGTGFQPGSDAFQVILHELGHAMGLKHPFEGSVQLVDGLDTTSNTLMSYDWSPGSFHQRYSPLDVAALTHLYGRATDTTGWSWSWGAAEFRLTTSGRAEFLTLPPDETNVLRAGGGDDTVNGGAGNDRLWGQAGHDILRGGRGDDQLFGDAGKDRLEADHGSDSLRGGDGADRLISGTQGNYYYGDSDTLHGEAGNDRIIHFGAAADIYGGAGHDTIIATEADVRVFGDGGADVIEIRASTAEVTGGAGDDIIRLSGYDIALHYDAPNQSGRDRVLGFNPYVDSLHFGSAYDAADISFIRTASGAILLEIGRTAIVFADLRFAEVPELQISFA